jgi:protein phosphatase
MPNPVGGIRLRGDALTSTGKVRENNEDNVFFWGTDRFALAIVADGMGGAAAGEEASRIAVQTIEQGLFKDAASPREQFFAALPTDVLSDKLKDAIRTANANIVQHALDMPQYKGMGTTVTLAIVRSAYAIVGHVGDSRAYLVDGHDGSISQITMDHSFVEVMVAAGHITREEAEDHPMRNVLYRALGQSVDIDPEIYHSYLRVGDRLVLCSDGLTLHVKPEEIARISLSDTRPSVISRKLIDLANERGGRDNVSVVVLIVEEDANAKAAEAERVVTSSDDDTLILRDRERRQFLSSESNDAPRVEPRESYTPHARLKPRLSAAPTVIRLYRDFEIDQKEGSDSLSPDA